MRHRERASLAPRRISLSPAEEALFASYSSLLFSPQVASHPPPRVEEDEDVEEPRGGLVQTTDDDDGGYDYYEDEDEDERKWHTKEVTGVEYTLDDVSVRSLDAHAVVVNGRDVYAVPKPRH